MTRSKRFLEMLKKGKQWEKTMTSWLDSYLADPKWVVVDSSDVYRDEDGDQYPDFTIHNKETERYFFIDAKQRISYKHKGHEKSFGFDQQFYNSYKNIGRKHNAKVLIGFYDPSLDANSVYMLDLDDKPDFIWDYGDNGHGEPICYRWHLSSLKRYDL